MAAIPQLTIPAAKCLAQLQQKIVAAHANIEQWFTQQWQLTRPPLMASVDLRNAGCKIAPVDTNLFPAGFNNLDPTKLATCSQAIQTAFSKYFANVTRVLLIPENHTRNIAYLENLATLADIFQQANLTIRLGSLLPEINKPTNINLPSGKTLELLPLQRQGNTLSTENFTPELIILNNDLSTGSPEILTGLEQTICPPLELGWASRLKSRHFQHYDTVTDEFAAMVDIDPWLFKPLFRNCGQVDFMDRKGEDCLIFHGQQLLTEIKEKYQQYQIPQPPFLVIKADAGTYGMGVMMVKSIDAIHSLNRRQRSHMATAKGKTKITKVIIQEGIYTFETLTDHAAVAEPVMYMIGDQLVGGFYRLHKKRGPDENLNSPGMEFEPIAFAPDNDQSDLFYLYSVIARLALVAAARELSQVRS